LDVEDLAELFRVSKQTVRDLIRSGIIPGYRIAQGKYIVTKRYLVDFIDEHMKDVVIESDVDTSETD
jgi:excisionase family DNA binding protein